MYLFTLSCDFDEHGLTERVSELYKRGEITEASMYRALPAPTKTMGGVLVDDSIRRDHLLQRDDLERKSI